MKKVLIIALAAIATMACTEAQKKSITTTEVDAAIVLTNAALKNLNAESEVQMNMGRDGEVVVLKITQQLGDEASTLRFAGLMAGDMAIDYALGELTKLPQVVKAMEEVFSFGYDIRIEYHDVEQGMIVAVPITRADLERHTAAAQAE